jgi:hypothetical protein
MFSGGYSWNCAWQHSGKDARVDIDEMLMAYSKQQNLWKCLMERKKQISISHPVLFLHVSPDRLQNLRLPTHYKRGWAACTDDTL